MNIFLPIETINREIDFKLVLGALLANGEHNIYVGQHDLIQKIAEKSNQAGLYIGKNIFHKSSSEEDGQRYKQLKKRGIDVIYLHEEGAVFAGKEKDWQDTLSKQYNIDFFDSADRICVWGEFQKEFDLQRGGKAPIFVTGHPRFDLYKNKWRSAIRSNLPNSFNKYVLINGNYGLANHGQGEEYVFSAKANYHPESVKERLWRIGFYTYSKHQMHSLIELVHQLAVAFPDINFVYRPHPSESHEFYETVFRGVSNIHVNHDGPVGPWILNSLAVIHDGCTTAIEAQIAGKPVINFKPFYSDKYDIWLPNQMGLRATNFQETEEILKDILTNEFIISNRSVNNDALQLLYNFSGDSFSALMNIIEEKIDQLQNTISVSHSLKKSEIKRYYLEMLLKTFIYKSLPKNKSTYKYHKRKFYGFDKTVIKKKIRCIEGMLEKKVKYILHNPSLIEIK